jgi:hypothetical protein
LKKSNQVGESPPPSDTGGFAESPKEKRHYIKKQDEQDKQENQEHTLFFVPQNEVGDP